MNITIGITLLIIFVGMLWFGKPRKGVSPRFMQIYVLGLLYTIVCMTAFVIGVALLILA
jgi:hypothetical protein